MKRFTTILNILMAFSLLIVITYNINSPKTPKVAYVRTNAIIENFKGMEEAQLAYQEKLTGWQNRLDTLNGYLAQLMNNYQQNAQVLPVSEVKLLETSINQQQQQLENYQINMEEKARQAEETFIQGAMNQINSYVKEYAESHGYDIVLGTTQYGSLMYGADGMDITDQILEGLNQEYRR